jgi:Tol biopolymer transport system component
MTARAEKMMHSPNRNCARSICSFVFMLLLACFARAAEPGLVFSLKTWDGDYTSMDVPGGVQTTPASGAIYTVNADGSGLRKIIQPGKSTDYPAASPDGKWVYFQSNFSGSTQIYRCDWEGKNPTNLTSPDQLTKQLKSSDHFAVKDAYGYVLSADGSKMVFTVHDGRTGRVVIANADGSSPELVNPGLGYIYMARLSPTHDRVVYSGPAKNYRLLITSLADNKNTELTPDHPECFVPQFTPDGKTVVFVRRDGDVYCVDVDGKNLKRLTEGNQYVEFKLSPKDSHGSTDGPDISPDGKQFAFIALKDGIPNVFVANIDGGKRQQITNRKSPCGRVRWSPDGKQLAFVSFEGKYPQLFVVPATGGEPRQMTKLDGAVYFVNWKPS